MTVYAHIENNEITGVYDNLPENWRNISNFFALASDPDLLRSLGWRTIVRDEPAYDPSIHRLEFPTYKIVDDEVHEQVAVTTVVQTQPIVVEQAEITIDYFAAHNAAVVALRTKRDILLKDTDYTQLADVMALNGPELTQAFVDYRQLLRDLPLNYENDPLFIDESTVVYPELPGAV